MTGQPPEDAAIEPELTPGTIRDRAVRGVLTLGVRTFAIRLVGLVGTVVLARFLQPTEFGQIALGLTLVSGAKLIMEGGLAVALVRRPQTVSRRELEVVFGFQLAVAVTITVVTFAIAAPLGTTGTVMAIMALSLPLDTFRAPTYVSLERQLSYGLIARIEVVEILAYNLAAIGAVAAGLGVYGVAGAVIVKSLSAAVMLINGPVGLVTPRWDRQLIRSLLGFGLAFQGKNILTVGRDQALNVLIAAIAGTASLGFWSLATRLLQPVVFILESLWRVIYPAMTRLLETGMEPKRLLGRSLATITVAVGFAVAALAGSSSALVPLLLGPDYQPISDVMPLLALGYLVGTPLYLCTTSYLFAQGRAARIFSVTVVKVTASLAIAAALLPVIGFQAAAIAILVPGVLEATYFGRLLNRETGVRAASTVTIPLLAASMGAGLGLLASDQFDGNLASVLAGGGSGLAVYLLWMIIARRRVLGELRDMATRAVQRQESGAVDPPATWRKR